MSKSYETLEENDDVDLDMNHLIEQKIKNRRADQILTLILDTCKSKTISGLTSDFINLRNLSISGVGLVTLENFPVLLNLVNLDLSDNEFSSGLHFLTACTKLRNMNLSSNNLPDVKELQPLTALVDLLYLRVINNNFKEDYRSEIFDLLPSLKSLDGNDRSNQSVDTEEEGSEEESLEYKELDAN